MSEKTFDLMTLPANSFIAWNVLTHTKKEMRVRLADETTEYFSVNHSGTVTTPESPFICSGTAATTSDGVPQLVVSITESVSLKSCTKTEEVYNEKADVIGYVYDFCIEDTEADRYDRIYVDIMIWNAA